jgi:hypothetical protein
VANAIKGLKTKENLHWVAHKHHNILRHVDHVPVIKELPQCPVLIPRASVCCTSNLLNVLQNHWRKPLLQQVHTKVLGNYSLITEEWPINILFYVSTYLINRYVRMFYVCTYIRTYVCMYVTNQQAKHSDVVTSQYFHDIKAGSWTNIIYTVITNIFLNNTISILRCLFPVFSAFVTYSWIRYNCAI